MTLVLLTPAFVVLAFAAFQAAMWSHARTETRVIARDTAALVARTGVPASDAEAAAMTALDADTDLRDVAVDVSDDGRLVVVTVRGSAPGIIRGTASAVSVRVAIPIEGWVP